MKKKLKQFFNHSYVKGGIFTIAPIIIMTILNKKYDWLTLKKISGYIKTAITFKVNIPIWILFILAIPAVLLVINLFRSLRSLSKNDVAQTFIDSLNYTKDTFGEITYKWEWFKTYDKKYKPINIAMYCPKDDCQLLCESVYDSILKCSFCGKTYISKHDEGQIIVLINKNFRDRYKDKYNLE